MSAPEPTAVERTIAEVLDDHRSGESNRDCLEGIGWVWACWCECGWHGRDRDHEAHQAEAVVAAIRAMSPPQQADLIGGDVEHITKPEWYDSGEPAPGDWLPGLAGRRLPNGNRSDLRFVPSMRVVTPYQPEVRDV